MIKLLKEHEAGEACTSGRPRAQLAQHCDTATGAAGKLGMTPRRSIADEPVTTFYAWFPEIWQPKAVGMGSSRRR
jgi:hypothetical protein